MEKYLSGSKVILIANGLKDMCNTVLQKEHKEKVKAVSPSLVKWLD